MLKAILRRFDASTQAPLLWSVLSDCTATARPTRISSVLDIDRCALRSGVWEAHSRTCCNQTLQVFGEAKDQWWKCYLDPSLEEAHRKYKHTSKGCAAVSVRPIS